MNKNILAFFIIVLSYSVQAYAEPAQAATPTQLKPYLIKAQEANSLETQGQYLAAKKIYEEILSDINIPSSEKGPIEESYYNLNMVILFSDLKTDTSSVHKVVTGDTLYEIAKEYKTTVSLLKKNNGLEGDTIYPGMDLKITVGNFSVHVDKSENRLWLYLDGKLIKKYPVATGRDNISPVGEFTIVNKLEEPTWFHAGAIVPPDSPDNILGTRWLGFDNPGYGIHGTTIPESIGTQATSGCVRMFNEDVEELYSILPVGTKVTIVN